MKVASAAYVPLDASVRKLWFFEPAGRMTTTPTHWHSYLVPSSPSNKVASGKPANTALAELLTRVAHGNSNAFAELYDRLSARVMGLVKRVLVDTAQSEEVVQEIFFEVWQSVNRYEPNKGGVATWILTIAHRRAVDRVRSSQSGRDRDIRIGSKHLTPAFDDVTEAAEIRIEHERVTNAMKRLSNLQREAVALAYYGGLSHSEISTKLRVPLGTVKTRLRDGMAKLRDELGVTS